MVPGPTSIRSQAPGSGTAARDGASIRGEAIVRVTALEDSELVLVDVG